MRVIDRTIIDYTKIQNIDIALSSLLNSIKGSGSKDFTTLESTVASTLSRNITHIGGTALTGRDWSSDIAKLQNIDVTLSNVRNTLDASIKGTQPRNITHVGGTALTGRDWSTDFAKLQNLDITLSNLRDSLRGANVKDFSTLESDVEVIASRLDITLSSLRDSLKGTGGKDFTTLESAVTSTLPRNITHVGGTALTGRNWSSDFAKLQNLDITISALRDAIISRINEQSLAAYTTTTLAANASWTSSTINAGGWGRITGSCYSDQAGTLYVEQSPNGTNWDVQSSFSYSAGALLGYSVEVVCPYVRIRYVNGATAQTVFRLYAFLRRI